MNNTPESYERNLIFTMLDATPIPVNFWDMNFNMISANDASAKMFGLANKQECVDNFNRLMPEYQPCGRKSTELSLELIAQAFEVGYLRVGWIHQDMAGNPIPVDAVLVRINPGHDVFVCVYLHDMREIRAAEAKSREAIERSEVMLNASPYMMTIWNDRFEPLYCNEKTHELFGTSSQEEFLANFHHLHPPVQPDGEDSAAKMRQVFEQAAQEGRAKFFWINLTMDGEIFPTEITLIRYPYDDTFLIVSYVDDLREKHAAEKKISEFEERSRLMLEYAPMAICIFNSKIEAIDCNEANFRMLRADSKEDYLNNWQDYLPPTQNEGEDSVARIRTFVREALEVGYSKGELKLLRADGHILHTEATYIRARHNDDFIVLEYSRDLTDMMDAQEHERQALEFANMLLEASPLFIEIFDKNRKMIDCNGRFRELFGIGSKEEYLRSHIKLAPKFQPDGTPTDEKLTQLVDRAFRDDWVVEQWEAMDNYGNTIPFEANFVKMERNGEPIVVSYNHDVRLIVRAMEEIQLREIAEAQNRAKGRFLAHISHEIRTPMNAILGISEIQLERETINSRTKEAFLRIRNSSNLLLSIINNLLDLSKVEADKMEINPREYSVANFIIEIAQLNMVYLGSKHLEFILNIDPNMPARLLGDELRITQIANNVLSNAFKYTDEGRVELVISTKPLDSENVALIISVSDTGRGMTHAQTRRIFNEEYVRFDDNAPTTPIEGTGLGMAITNRLVKMMGGEIELTSAPGKGTKINITVPQGIFGAEILGEENAKSLENFDTSQFDNKRLVAFTREPMPYGRVLVVDDVESNLHVAKGLLLPYGLTVETADSGMIAVEKIHAGAEYDIIFMDHMMPEMDGIEAAGHILQMGYAHPIVALTANALVGQDMFFMDNGFESFISKPIDTRVLNATLNRLIRDKQPPEVLEAARANGDISPDIAEDMDMLIEPFLRDAVKALVAIESIIDAGILDVAALRLFTVHVHSMKSALRNIDEDDLADIAMGLEQAGRDANTEEIFAKTPRFVAALRGVVHKLESHLVDNANDAQAKPAADNALLKAHLNGIIKACAKFSKKSAQIHLDGLAKMTHAPSIRHGIDKISINMLHGDFDEAANTAKSLFPQ